MDIVAHVLWAGAAAEALRHRTYLSTATVGGIVLLAALPDVVHLAPLAAWALSQDAPLSLVYRTLVAPAGRGPPVPEAVHALGANLYFIMHSAPVAAALAALAWAARQRFPVVMLGWWLHIAIDLFTHSGDYYAVPVLYPFSDYAWDGIAWRPPWFLVLNYLALAVTYFWRLKTRGRRVAPRDRHPRIEYPEAGRRRRG